MNRCATPIGSTTARWLAAASRLYSTSQRRSQDENTKLLDLLSQWKYPTFSPPSKSEQSPPLPVESTDATIEQDHRTQKVSPEPSQQETNERDPYSPAAYIRAAAGRAEENVHDSPPTLIERRPLPVSPLMDPAIIASKQKNTGPKAKPSKNLEGFQRILAKNPYALALATPVRRCQLTSTTLPSFFLQDFNLMEHPENGAPWYVPRSLTSKYAPASPQNQRDLGLEAVEESDPNNHRQPDGQCKQNGGEFTPKIGHTVYALSSQLALRAMQETAGYARKNPTRSIKRAAQRGLPLLDANAHSQFVPERYRQTGAAYDVLRMAGWRSDMHEFVLELMRRRAVEGLVHVTRLKRGYVVGCSGWEDALAKPQVGVFLWTGGNGDQEMDVPPEFATLEKKALEDKTRKVPVHNLRTLLGREKLAELRKKLPNGIFENEVVVLKHKTITVKLQMRLWKLQGYLAEFRDFSGEGEDQEVVDDFEEEEDELEQSEPDDDGRRR